MNGASSGKSCETPDELQARLTVLSEQLRQERIARATAEKETQKIWRVMKMERAIEQARQRSPQLEPLLRRFWDAVLPMDVVGHDFVRVGRDYDGGYVMLDDFSTDQIAYSFGINDDVSWDLAMAERHVPVYMYDPTIDGLPQEHPLFHFQRRGICGLNDENSQSSECATYSRLLEENGHAERAGVILKMDVEGAEWASLSAIPEAQLRRIDQLTLEVHDLHELGEADKRAEDKLSLLERLRQTHVPVHLHANNSGSLRAFGGYMLPDILELTFVLKDKYRFEPCRRTFPTALDMPNMHDYAEIILSRHLPSH